MARCKSRPSPEHIVIQFPVLAEMKGEPVTDRSLYDTQSISATAGEKLLYKILGLKVGLQPATVARRLLFKGLAAFIKDRQLPENLDEIYDSAMAMVEQDDQLRTIKQVLESQPEKKGRKARRTATR